MSDIFKAIADPTRRSILLKVAENPMTMNEIAADFKVSRPAISKHIKILEESQLIEIKSDMYDGRQRNCYAQLEALQEINDYLNELHQFWDKRLDNLGEYLKTRHKSK